jgi:hypothetical protein
MDSRVFFSSSMAVPPLISFLLYYTSSITGRKGAALEGSARRRFLSTRPSTNAGTSPPVPFPWLPAFGDVLVQVGHHQLDLLFRVNDLDNDGRSSDMERSLAAWILLSAPNPRIPLITVAPARSSSWLS